MSEMQTTDTGMHFLQALKVQPVVTTKLPDGRMVIIHQCPDCGVAAISIIDGLDLMQWSLPDEAYLRAFLRHYKIPEIGWAPAPRLAEGLASCRGSGNHGPTSADSPSPC